jgi:hypothetical protein
MARATGPARLHRYGYMAAGERGRVEGMHRGTAGRTERMARDYCRCHACGSLFNERSGDLLNRAAARDAKAPNSVVTVLPKITAPASRSTAGGVAASRVRAQPARFAS